MANLRPSYSSLPYRSMLETTTATRELSLSYGEFLMNFPSRPHTDCFPECYKPSVGFAAASHSTCPYKSSICVLTITFTLDLFSIGASLDDGALSNSTTKDNADMHLVVVINARSGEDETWRTWKNVS